jgi:arylsulfatase A-like enzyme
MRNRNSKTYYKSKIINILLLFFLTISIACKKEKITHVKSQPNVVLIYLDDLGYGDLSAYGATEIKTPNIDALANGGVRFTDGYATSATCTPSRYGMLTGIHPIKNEIRILPGSAKMIIDTAQITLPKVFKKAGYNTGIVGKWHLGLGNGNINWNTKITPGPNEVGFDYSVIMAATQDRVPTVFIEDGLVDGLEKDDPIYVNYKKNFERQPTGKNNPELLTMKAHHGHDNTIVNGIGRIGFMKGGKNAIWKDTEIADYFLEKAQSFVKENKEEPFFLYYAMQQPHQPRTPHPRFVGSTDMGARGDVIMEADWCIGQFIKTLEEEGLLENTIIVFSSDNGPVLNDGYYDGAVEKLGKHTPAGSLRGGKYSLFEAGAKVPFFVYWKGKIEPKVSNALVSQMDLLASFANFLEVNVPKTDSQNLLNVFLGKSDKGRKNLIVEAKRKAAYRSGDWLMIPPYPKCEPIQKNVNIEVGCDSVYQLYNLKKDISQKNNLAKTNSEKLQELIKEYKDLK